MAVRCGYATHVPAGAGVPAEVGEEIARVEHAGFDGIFFGEHHGVDGYASDPLTLAGHALARTTRLRAGTLPLLLPLHNPALVAERAAMTGFLSGGRLVLGVGAGYLEPDFAQVGVPFNERAARLDEGLAVIAGVWSGPLEHRGRFYRVRQTRAPLHRPAAEPPIWITSSTPTGMRRAAALRPAAGVMLNPVLDSGEVRALVDVYRRACAEEGSDPGTIGVIRHVWFGDPGESERFFGVFESELRTSVNFAAYQSKPWVRELASRRWTQDVAFAGEPEAVAAALSTWCDATGVGYVVVKLHWGRRDFSALTEQLRRSARFVRAGDG